MSDPLRLRGASPEAFERELLGSATDDAMPGDAEARALARLGLVAATVAVVASAGAGAAAASHGASLSAPPAASAATKIASAVRVG
jgi:hypothetical protein